MSKPLQTHTHITRAQCLVSTGTVVLWTRNQKPSRSYTLAGRPIPGVVFVIYKCIPRMGSNIYIAPYYVQYGSEVHACWSHKMVKLCPQCSSKHGRIQVSHKLYSSQAARRTVSGWGSRARHPPVTRVSRLLCSSQPVQHVSHVWR